MTQKKFLPIHIIALLLSLLLLSRPGFTEAAGETRYISDKIKIYARAGAGTEFKLIAPLITGDPVTLLGEKKEDWVHIGYGKNRQGWIQERFLTAIEPSAKRLAKAKAKVEQLEQSTKAKIVSLTETNKEYRKGNTGLLREVKELRNKLQTVEKKYKTLHEESAAFLELQAEHKNLLAESQLRREREATILAECELLKTAYRIKWFLAGGGVLLIGFFIGILLQAFRNRKKKGSSLRFK
ncbi:MAG: TIGR04211 family SH3 domain-containing protein [Deltaproteobacteria bacterium]|nr:TIGR04211 family SH3 domain-containing protein [Candidatus Tharpella sp.]